MKTKTKVLLILLAIGVAGMAATTGYIMGSGAMISREAEKTYAVTEAFETIKLNGKAAQMTLLPAGDGETRVEASAKAWLPGEIDMDAHIRVAVEDGTLVITETPFPDEFFGIFPQPYEMTLRVYVPQDVYENGTGARS